MSDHAEDRRSDGIGNLLIRAFLVLLALCVLVWLVNPILWAIFGVLMGIVALVFSLVWIFLFAIPAILVLAALAAVIVLVIRALQGPAT